MTKDEIFETALEEFSIELDRTQSHADMLGALTALRKGTELESKSEPVADAPARQPVRVQNPSGIQFDWQPHMAGNADLTVTAWSDDPEVTDGEG